MAHFTGDKAGRIWTIEYSLNDTHNTDKKEKSFKSEYSLTPSDMNFETILKPKMIFGKMILEKKISLGTILILGNS